MSRKKLPEFDSPTMDELREIWHRYPEGHEVRRLVLEIVRARRVIKDAEELRQIVQRVWSEDVGGDQVALYKLRLLLKDEAKCV
jgi:hypothetical protein